MRSRHIPTILAIVALSTFGAAACGSESSTDEEDRSAKPAKEAEQESAEGSGAESYVTYEGRPVRANDRELVLDVDDKERTFAIRPEDLRSVDPGHVASHIGIPTLAFRVYVDEVDGEEYAIAAEEMAASDL